MKRVRSGILAAAFLFIATSSRGVILYGTGDPTANTTAPTGALAGSGWQYEGAFNGLGGTVIGTNYFVTAKHIGGSPGNIFVFNGVSYTTTAAFPDPSSDLQIWRVSGNFPTHAPLFSGAPGAEVNLALVVIGYGRQRGSPVTVGSDSHLGGWLWGTFDDVQRWGTNVVGSIFFDPTYGDLLRAPFNSNAGPNEAQLAPGDSGGAVFVFNPATSAWELAGINLAADGPFSTSQSGANSFNAAMFDTTGLFVPSDAGGWTAAPNPSAFYATQIAAHRGFIEATVMGLSSVVSRKTHGGGGTFDVDLPESGSPGIECRSGGTTNSYQLVFTFGVDVSVGTASVTSGTGSVSNFTAQGKIVTVNLTSVTNAQTITVTLKNVNNGTDISDVEAKMSLLIGDTNADASVDSADITQTKTQSGTALSQSNFRQDINADGSIDSADISLVKSKSGTGLPSSSATLSAPEGSTSLRPLPLPETKSRSSAILPRKRPGESRQ